MAKVEIRGRLTQGALTMTYSDNDRTCAKRLKKRQGPCLSASRAFSEKGHQPIDVRVRRSISLRTKLQAEVLEAPRHLGPK